jgi:hypothetical protein
MEKEKNAVPAAEILPQIYEELKRLSSYRMAREAPDLVAGGNNHA